MGKLSPATPVTPQGTGAQEPGGTAQMGTVAMVCTSHQEMYWWEEGIVSQLVGFRD